MIRKKTLQIGAQFGVAQPMLEAYDTIIGLPGTQNIDIDLTKKSNSEIKGYIVFPFAHQSEQNTYRYSVLAKAFELNGYKPIFVIPDNCLPISRITGIENPDKMVQNELIKYRTKNILQRFNYDLTYMSEFVLDDRNYEEIIEEHIKQGAYKGVDVTSFATASTRKMNKKYHIESKNDKEIWRSFVKSGLILVDAYENLIESFNVVSTLAHDAKYNQGGIALSVAANNNVHAYSTTLGWINESIVIGNITDRNSLPHYEDKQIVKEFLNQPLDQPQRKRVEEVMSDRISGGGQTRARYSAQTTNSIDASSNNITVGLFTNLIWDANLEVNNCPYPNVFNWIRDTISELGGRVDVELVIKPHPAENSRGTNEPVRGWITENYPDLPNNITILKADTDINTYEMISDIDVGIVYNSTVGFEMVYAGTPAITAGETHYRNLDITHDPETSDDYIELLENITQIDFSISKEQQQRVDRYIYFLFEGKHLDFPFIRTTEVRSSNTGTRNYKLKSISNRYIRESSALSQIVNRCVKGQPALAPEFDWLLA